MSDIRLWPGKAAPPGPALTGWAKTLVRLVFAFLKSFERVKRYRTNEKKIAIMKSVAMILNRCQVFLEHFKTIWSAMMMVGELGHYEAKMKKSELGSKMIYASQFEAAAPVVTISLVADGLTTPRPP